MTCSAAAAVADPRGAADGSRVAPVRYRVAMRVHIRMDDELVQRVDRRVGAGGRNSFIAEAVQRALRDESPWDVIEASIGSIDATGHEWDKDPSAWVRQQRQS